MAMSAKGKDRSTYRMAREKRGCKQTNDVERRKGSRNLCGYKVADPV